MRLLISPASFVVSALIGTTAIVGVIVHPAAAAFRPHHHHQNTRRTPPSTTSPLSSKTKKFSQQLNLSTSSSSDLGDLSGKKVVQRTFYRLSPGSQVQIPNALVLEERLRYIPNPDNAGYIKPDGPRTIIFRKGTAEDEITNELYRLNLHESSTSASHHSGPGRMDTSYATALFLAAHPKFMQGAVMEIACETGVAGILGCIGAHMASGEYTPPHRLEDDVLTVPEEDDTIFPARLERLVLSDERSDAIQDTFDTVKEGKFHQAKVQVQELPWSVRIPKRRYDTFYRAIVGSDVDFTYPSAKELARVVANSLLPSNPAALEDQLATVAKSSGSSSFGGLGMEMDSSPPSTAGNNDGDKKDPATEVDPSIPPVFMHVCPENREDEKYLRQFLEKGFKMNVATGYLKLQKLAFVFQTYPEDASEADIEDLDLELKEERGVAYKSIVATHNIDYGGYGTGEYFFPLETGEYEGGSRSTYLEPEEGSAF